MNDVAAPLPAPAPGFEGRVRESFGRQAFMATLGALLDSVGPGEVTVGLVPHAGLGQQHGYVHAGVVATLADTACGYAAYSLMPADHDVLTVEFKANLLAPAVGERLEARAQVIRPGRTLSVCRCDVVAVRDGETELVAVMTATILGRALRVPSGGAP